MGDSSYRCSVAAGVDPCVEVCDTSVAGGSFTDNLPCRLQRVVQGISAMFVSPLSCSHPGASLNRLQIRTQQASLFRTHISHLGLTCHLSAHSKFTKSVTISYKRSFPLADTSCSRLFKTLYPNGLDEYATPGQTPTPSRKGSTYSVQSSAAPSTSQSRPSGFLARWGFTSSAPPPPALGSKHNPSSGEIEELVLSGAAFGELLIPLFHPRHSTGTLNRGYGLFNLVLSLLPSKVRYGDITFKEGP